MHRQQLIDARGQHKKEAGEETAFYKRHVEAAPAKYQSLCSLYERLCAADGTADFDNFATQLSGYAFEVATDYQQDKSYPHWGASAQPGETYFYSKIGLYVHIIE